MNLTLHIALSNNPTDSSRTNWESWDTSWKSVSFARKIANHSKGSDAASRFAALASDDSDDSRGNTCDQTDPDLRTQMLRDFKSGLPRDRRIRSCVSAQAGEKRRRTQFRRMSSDALQEIFSYYIDRGDVNVSPSRDL